MSRLRAVFVYATIVAVSAAVALLAAEWFLQRRAARAQIPFYNRLYPYVMFRPMENAEYVSPDTMKMSHYRTRAYHYTNEDGFRVPAMGYRIPREKPAGQLRIAVLGSSAVQLASTFETTLPGSLKRHLQETQPGREVEVINAGITSCVSRQSIAHFVFTVADYRPDIVVLYDGVNDIGLPLVYEARSNFPYNFQIMEQAWEQFRASRREPLHRVLLGRSELYRALRDRFSKTRDAETPRGVERDATYGVNRLTAARVIADPEFVRNHIAAYLANWEKLIELSRAYNFVPVLVLQPTGGLEREYAIPLNMEFFNLDRRTAEQWQDAFDLLYAEASRQIDGLRRRYPGIVILNWSRQLAPAKEHYWDTVHVYDETNMVLAERLAAEFKAALQALAPATHGHSLKGPS